MTIGHTLIWGTTMWHTLLETSRAPGNKPSQKGSSLPKTHVRPGYIQCIEYISFEIILLGQLGKNSKKLNPIYTMISWLTVERLNLNPDKAGIWCNPFS